MISIDLDDKKWKQTLAKFKKQQSAKQSDTMNRIAKYLLEESIKRAPIDEGNLQSSIHDKHDSHSASVYIPANSPASDYALYMHEDNYELGPESQRKQSGQSERVGNHYLLRALTENENEILKKIKKILEK